MSVGLEGRGIVVTGGGSGIGAATCRLLALKGATVGVLDRNADAARAVAEEIGGLALACDVGASDQVDAAIARADAELGGLTGLVNNAGLGLYDGDFAEHDLEAEDHLLMVNVRAVLRLTHAALGSMLERGEGAIINVSSMASFAPDPNAPTYAASKAWVTSFTEGLRAQVGGSGVRVLALTPGLVPTQFQERAGVDARVPSPFWLDPDEVVDTALADLRAGRGISVPGMAYRAIRVAMQFTPRRVYLPLSDTLQKRLT